MSRQARAILCWGVPLAVPLPLDASGKPRPEGRGPLDAARSLITYYHDLILTDGGEWDHIAVAWKESVVEADEGMKIISSLRLTAPPHVEIAMASLCNNLGLRGDAARPRWLLIATYW